jgi:hypothetical protein
MLSLSLSLSQFLTYTLTLVAGWLMVFLVAVVVSAIVKQPFLLFCKTLLLPSLASMLSDAKQFISLLRLLGFRPDMLATLETGLTQVEEKQAENEVDLGDDAIVAGDGEGDVVEVKDTTSPRVDAGGESAEGEIADTEVEVAGTEVTGTVAAREEEGKQADDDEGAE